MKIEKKKGDKLTINLSPSSINTFFQSPLLFYLTYISKVPDDTAVPVCYGLSGGVVHESLEKYAKKEVDRDGAITFFSQEWDKVGLQLHRDMFGRLLNKNEYLAALLSGLSIVDQHTDHICEEMISLPFLENETMDIVIKGIIDLQAIQKNNEEKVIVDYKTNNSIKQDESFTRQALFYNLLLLKKKKFIPSKTTFHYLKLNTPKSYRFTSEDIQQFENELKALADTLFTFGTDISNYPEGNIDDLFNSKKKACLQEIARRKQVRI